MDELYYDAIDLLKKMIGIPSPSREERCVADMLEKQMDQWNLAPKRCGNNVWCVADGFDGQLPTLLLNSHIDTVRPADGWTFPPFEATTTDEERIYGLGSNDAGASVVSLLAAFRYLAECDCAYNLVFLASCEEEVSGRGGIEMALPLLPNIDVAIVGEPTAMQPAIAEKGLMVLDGTVKGVAGHAARNEGENAIYNAIEVIGALRSVKFENQSELLGPVKVSVTQIEIVVDVRTTDAYTNAETLELLQQAAGSKCELVPRSLRLAPSSIAPSHPLVVRLGILGKRPFGSPTLSDQALMPFPSIKLGPGDSARSHTADEYILTWEIRDAIHTYIALLEGCHIK